MPAELSLRDLVRNGTLSPEMGALLWTAAAEVRSFVITAVPRMAGKSTLMHAMLGHAPPGTPMRTFKGTSRQAAELAADRERGYIVVPEISRAPVETYLWGEPVRRAFRLLPSGFALATALHAPNLDETFAIICGGNAIPDDLAARIDLVVYVRSIGRWDDPTRRVVESIHEVEGVSGGRPRARLLHRWNEASDGFETLATPSRFGDAMALRRRAKQIAGAR